MFNCINTAGWDIGGAHLKLALRSDDTLRVFQWPCPLWKGLHELVNCLHQAFKEFPNDSYTHHITMTGELVDIFSDRNQGVREIISTFVQSMPAKDKLKVYSNSTFIDAKQALQDTQAIASANWLASGHYLSRFCENTLFIDMGSTTTDLLLIKDGKVSHIGFKDAERLRSGELVYTGIVRSCVNTICESMLFQNELVPMMAENFAVSADVYRILGTLPTHADSGATMDGRAKDKTSSMRRLARMIGEDYTPDNKIGWEQAAQYISQRQKDRIATQATRLLSSLGSNGNIVAAGVGRFLIQQVATDLKVPYCDFVEKVLVDNVRYDEHAADCAPAVSLALQ